MSENSAAQTFQVSGVPIAAGAHIGKYEVVHRIATGGMAEIFLVRAVGIYGFEKYVVLKRILPQHAANDEFVRMFLKEARVAASLDHANIAQVHDIGEAGGSTFFTMEYLHGEDARFIMRYLESRGGRLPLEHASGIVMGAAAGLHFAHEKKGPDGRSLGIVHRDISPANIVVTYDGGVKLVDFGIAKLATDPELSQRYALKGKLAYMSPEQLHNQPIDRRSDVFSLGIVLYELTTHARLFKGSTEVETMKSVLDGFVPRPTSLIPDYPPALERIVMRALERLPGDRYQTARELQFDLEAYAHEERVRLSQAGLAEWMVSTFGPKQEIWHTLAPSAGQTAAGTAPARETTAATKVTPRPEVGGLPSQGVVDSSVPIELSAPAKARRRRSALPMVAVVALAAAGGGLWVARDRLLGSAPPPAAAQSPVVLVTEQGQVAVERGASAAPAPPAQAIPEAPAAPPAATAAPAPAGEAAPSNEHREPDPAGRPRSRHAAEPGVAAGGGGFSATFARRESEIRRCFIDHPDSAASTTEISLRFDVARSGHVTHLDVLPPAVGGSALGACLSTVGKGTVFPKQAAPLTFRIPLTVQLGTTGKRAP